MSSNNILFTFLNKQIGDTTDQQEIKDIVDAFNGTSGAIFKSVLKDIVKKAYPNNSPQKQNLLNAIDGNSVQTLKNGIKSAIERLETNPILRDSEIVQQGVSKLTETAADVITSLLPKWNIVFEEKRQGPNEKTNIKIGSDGVLLLSKGPEAFKYDIKQNYNRFLVNDETRNVINKVFKTPDAPLDTRAIVFRKFLSQDLYSKISKVQSVQNNGDFKQDFKKDFEADLLSKQENFVNKIANLIADSMVNNRLLKDTTIGHEDQMQKVKFLQLFNFVREPTEQEKTAGFDPHIMDFDTLYKKFKDIYDLEPEVKQTDASSSGLQKKRTRFTNAAIKVMLDVYIRIVVVDFCLKTLPALDCFLYTKDIAEIEPLAQFIYIEAKNQLRKNGLENIFNGELPKLDKTEEILKFIEDSGRSLDKEILTKIIKQKLKEEGKTEAEAEAEAKEIVKNAKIKQQPTRGEARRSYKERKKQEAKERAKERAIERAREKVAEVMEKSALRIRNNLEDFSSIIKTEADEIFYEKIKSNFADILNKLADIFHVSKQNREIDQFKRFTIKTLKVYDVHTPDYRPVFNKVTEKKETFLVPKKNVNLPIVNYIKQVNREPIGLKDKKQKILDFKEKPQNKIKNSDLFEKKETITYSLDENVNIDDFVLQRYIKFGKLNPKYIKDKNLSLLENRVLNLEYVREKLKNVGNSVPLYDCDKADPNAIFAEPPIFGLRIVTLYNSKKGRDVKQNQFFVKQRAYDILDDRENYLSCREDLQSADGKSNRYVYNLLKIAKTEMPVESNLTVEQMSNLMKKTTFQKIFYPLLREKLLKEEEIKIVMDYCLPVKEIAAMAIIHSFLLNNNENIRELLQSSKDAVVSNLKVLEETGDKTGDSQAVIERQRQIRLDIMNEGSPGGPLNFDLLKIWLRTPIHILRGLATIIDPNLFIADKIVMGASIVGALAGQKIYFPYIAASLALLPFPIFTPPAPSLSAYNIAVPLGPIFLILEPLLWDLPWFQNMNSDPSNPMVAENLAAIGVDVNNPVVDGESINGDGESINGATTSTQETTDKTEEEMEQDEFLDQEIEQEKMSEIEDIIKEIVRRCTVE